jgi:nucleotide sugar dehydrogenase
MRNKVCVFGLGFVGLTLSIILAEKGFEVIGLEKNDLLRRRIKKGNSHIYEPLINERLKKIIKNKKFTIHKNLNSRLAVGIYIVTVGTPLNKKKKCNFSMIKSVSREIANHLKVDDLIILRSTVMIGTTKNIVFPILKKKKINFNLCYCPERTLEGNALKELVKLPQIISGINKNARDLSKIFFKKISREIIEVNDINTAEMIKLVDNMQRDVKFALSNEVAILCDNSSVNVNEVINLGKKNYPRTNLFRPGLVGGPCLEKDTYILAQKYIKKIQPKIALASRSLNENLPKYSVKLIEKLFLKKNKSKKNIKIGIFGIAFKGEPETNDMRGSTIYELVKQIRKRFLNSKIYAYDKLVDQFHFKRLKIFRVKKKIDIFNDSNIVIIHNNSKNNDNIILFLFYRLNKTKYKLDIKILTICYRY